MQIVIPFKTPTVNHLYTRNRFGNQCKTAEAAKLKKEIMKICEGYTNDTMLLRDRELKVLVQVFEDWYCKDGSVKKKDVANREKFLIDSVFEGLGLHDKFIFAHKMKKVQSKSEQSIITIEVNE